MLHRRDGARCAAAAVGQARPGQAWTIADRLQERCRQGPSCTAAARDALITSDDVWSDPRWALDPAGEHPPPQRSVIAFRLPRTGNAAVLAVWGTGELTLAETVAQTSRASMDLAAAVSVVRAGLDLHDLRVALVSNRTMGAAMGVTMAVHRLTFDAAAQLLRSTGNDSNVRLSDADKAVLFTGQVSELPTGGLRRRLTKPPA